MIATNSKDQDKTNQILPSKTRIMIVDDQSTTRNILQRKIENSGHEVITAESGEQALQYLEDMPITLILLDIVMPNMDGFEVLKEIRQRYSMSALPVIMVSVRDESSDILQAFSIGANDYVTKPLDLPVICARIDAHLAYKNFNDEHDFARKELEQSVSKKRIKLLTQNKVIKFEKAQRRKAEQKLNTSETYYKSLIENVHDIIAVFEEDGTIVCASLSLESILGYKPEERIGKNTFELIHPEDKQAVANKFAQAFTEPEVTFIETVRFRHKDGSWRLLEAVGSTTSHEGRQRGIVNARDITERKLAEQEIEKSVALYQQSLTNSIKTIALIVEKRDPYTSGHMGRVAELSVSIGKKLGLSDKELEGLYLGAMIHDIGNIYIPSDILNRPGKLSKAEFEIVKSHPQIGYDIIKEISFPWPIADMILTEHEKLDGSGYPHGLKGNEICYESQIILVADVVEALSSHRPYRPSKGIDEGLKIIREGKGKLYNSDVVEACIDLFQKDGFEFSASS